MSASRPSCPRLSFRSRSALETYRAAGVVCSAAPFRSIVVRNVATPAKPRASSTQHARRVKLPVRAIETFSSAKFALLKNEDSGREQDGGVQERIRRIRHQQISRDLLAMRHGTDHIEGGEIRQQIIQEFGNLLEQGVAGFLA